jgi:hypothetical protein
MATTLLPESCDDIWVLCPQRTGNLTHSGTEILIMLECIINALLAVVLSTILLPFPFPLPRNIRLRTVRCFVRKLEIHATLLRLFISPNFLIDLDKIW